MNALLSLCQSAILISLLLARALAHPLESSDLKIETLVDGTIALSGEHSSQIQCREPGHDIINLDLWQVWSAGPPSQRMLNGVMYWHTSYRLHSSISGYKSIDHYFSNVANGQGLIYSFSNLKPDEQSQGKDVIRCELAANTTLEKREPKGPVALKDGTPGDFPFDPTTFSVDWESADCQGRHQHPAATQPATEHSSLITFRGQQYWSCSYAYFDFLNNFQGYVGVLWYIKANKKHLAYVVFMKPKQNLLSGSICSFVTRDPPAQPSPPPRSKEHSWVKGQPPREPHKKLAAALSPGH